jgi:hypothetical protein
MKQLSTFRDDAKFYRGTIIVLKGIMNTPGGIFDARYAMILGYGGMGDFQMLDVHRSMGGIIFMDLKPNIPGHVAVNKQGIRDWVDLYFKELYSEEGYTEWSAKIDDITFIEDLDDYFIQTNRDLFVAKETSKVISPNEQLKMYEDFIKERWLWLTYENWVLNKIKNKVEE